LKVQDKKETMKSKEGNARRTQRWKSRRGRKWKRRRPCKWSGGGTLVGAAVVSSPTKRSAVLENTHLNRLLAEQLKSVDEISWGVRLSCSSLRHGVPAFGCYLVFGDLEGVWWRTRPLSN
jgi:hypothetical protein